MWVIVIGGNLVHVQQRLVDTLFKLQGTLESLDTTAPLISLRFLKQAAGNGHSQTPINKSQEANNLKQTSRLL